MNIKGEISKLHPRVGRCLPPYEIILDEKSLTYKLRIGDCETKSIPYPLFIKRYLQLKSLGI